MVAVGNTKVAHLVELLELMQFGRDFLLHFGPPGVDGLTCFLDGCALSGLRSQPLTRCFSVVDGRFMACDLVMNRPSTESRNTVFFFSSLDMNVSFRKLVLVHEKSVCILEKLVCAL
jgi:hypothetical protein